MIAKTPARRLFCALGLVLAASAAVAQEEEKVLNIYNWSDYIAEDTIRNFEKETGIRVRYDNFDNNEIVHAKMVALIRRCLDLTLADVTRRGWL